MALVTPSAVASLQTGELVAVKSRGQQCREQKATASASTLEIVELIKFEQYFFSYSLFPHCFCSDHCQRMKTLTEPFQREYAT